MMAAVKIAGVGHAAPKRRVTSAEIERRLGLPDGWIVKRSGIEARRYAAENEALSDFAVAAGNAALERAAIPRSEVALLLLATSTPDHLLPPSAPLVAHRLNLPKAGGIDLAAACGGFIYALTLGASYASALNAPVIIIAGNILSRRINDADRNTSSLFADAAGAVVLVPSPGASSGIAGAHLIADGSAYGLIQIPGGGSRKPFSAITEPRETLMVLEDGKAVFSKAVSMMTAAAQNALKQAGLTATDIDHFIPHQANTRMMQAVAQKLDIPSFKIRSTIAEFGNSSAATIPFTLSATLPDHPIARGDYVLMTAAGAGMTGGAVVLRW